MRDIYKYLDGKNVIICRDMESDVLFIFIILKVKNWELGFIHLLLLIN